MIFGDIICVEGDCTDGQAAVDQLKSVYAALDDSLKPTYQTAVSALVASFEAENAKWTRQVPFSPVCCTIKEIGLQAQNLMAQMAQVTGTASLSPLVKASEVSSLISAALAIGLIGAVGFLGYKVYKAGGLKAFAHQRS